MIKPTVGGLRLLIAIAGALFLATVGVYVMMSGRLGADQSQYRKMQAQVRDSKQIAERLSASEQTYLAAQQQLSYLENSVSTTDYIPTLLKQLEYLGKSVDLKVLGVRPRIEPPAPPKPPEAQGEGKDAKTAQAPPEKKPYDSLSIDITVEGKYDNAMRFLYRVTSFPKILEVNTVQMGPTAQSETLGSPQLTVQLNVTAYVFSLGETPATQTTDVAPQTGKATQVTLKRTKAEGRSSGEA